VREDSAAQFAGIKQLLKDFDLATRDVVVSFDNRTAAIEERQIDEEIRKIKEEAGGLNVFFGEEARRLDELERRRAGLPSRNRATEARDRVFIALIDMGTLGTPEGAKRFVGGMNTGEWGAFHEWLGTFSVHAAEVAATTWLMGKIPGPKVAAPEEPVPIAPRPRVAPKPGVRGFLRNLRSYWERSTSSLTPEEAAALAKKEGFGFEIGRASRFENARDSVVIGKGNLKEGLVNRMELAEEIQHGVDRATHEATKAIRRSLSNEEFHAEHFERILARYKAGGHQFLTPEDIKAFEEAIKELRAK